MRKHQGTLNQEQMNRLYDAGFSKFEIETFDQAKEKDGTYQKPFNIDSPVWQEVIKKRTERAKRIRDGYYADTSRPLDRRWLSRIINEWYVQHKNADPFDWLKREYRRIKHLTGKKVKKATRKLQGFAGARQYTVKKSFN
jgi:hypothetical protein